MLAAGAKLRHVAAGPAYGRSPAIPTSILLVAASTRRNANVAYHIGEYWYNEHLAPAWGQDPEPVFFEMSAWQWQHTWGETPIQQTLSAIIFDNLLV